MRRIRNIELELPWKWEAFIIAKAMVASGVVCGLGWIIFQLILDEFLQRVSEGFNISMKTSFSFENIWALPLIVFGGLAIRFYEVFKREVIRAIPKR